MSFFDDASLAFLPSGAAGKDGKAYSIKPTDGTGDFTFSRGSNLAATRVGPTGLIEKGRENLLLQSNNFDTTWTLSSGATLTSGISDPDGGTNAWQLNFDGTSGGRVQQQISVTNGGVYAFSFYARVASGTKDISFYSNIGASHTATLTTTWQRFEAFSQSSNTLAYPQIRTKDTSVYSIEIYKAQYEIGLAATDVISTGATTGKAGLLEDEPRFDYSGGATCPSLLLEGSRTNLLTYSEQMNLWDNGTASVTANVTTSPDGFQNADSINNTADVSTFVSASNVAHTFSLFVKQGTSATASIDMSDGVTGDVITTFTFATKTFSGTIAVGSWTSPSTAYQDYGNGWYRISLTATKGAGASIGYKIIASGTGTTFVWGAQLEAGAYPTSYIPNHSGGSVTRGAEGQGYGGFSSLIGQTEGTLFLDIENAEDGTEIFSLNRSTANAIFLRAISNVYGAYIWSDGSTYAPNTLISVNDRIKIAIAYQSNNFAIYANGVQVSTNNSLTWTPNITIDSLNFNVGGYISSKGAARYNQVLIIPERISNADLETLTTI